MACDILLLQISAFPYGAFFAVELKPNSTAKKSPYQKRKQNQLKFLQYDAIVTEIGHNFGHNNGFEFYLHVRQNGSDCSKSSPYCVSVYEINNKMNYYL